MSAEGDEPDWARRFGGVERLYGPDALRRFGRAKVAVLGVGGVGSWAVEALARSGVGQLTLVDMDHVAESNINRQLPALQRTLGRSKIGVLAERVAEINPRCGVVLIDDFVTLDNLGECLPPGRCDVVLDCIDNARTKAGLLAHLSRQGTAVLTVGGAGGRRDPAAVRLADLTRSEQDPLLAGVRRRLRREYGFSRDPRRRFGIPCVYSGEPARLAGQRQAGGLNCGGLGSVMAVTATFAMYGAAWVLERLAAGEDRST